MKKQVCETRGELQLALTFEEVIMDSLDWELTQLCRKMEKQRKAREGEQKFQPLSPEEVRDLEKGYRGNKRELERMNINPLERLNEQELHKAVSMTLNMAVLDIVGTEGTRGLLRIRKYCGDDLILERLVEAFEQMFAYDKLDDTGKEKRRRDFMEEDLD
jgi:hypothetical protein